MVFVVIALILVLVVFAPQLWVKHVLAKHNVQLEQMPGTGGELACHLLDQFSLHQVKVEATQAGSDHYDPQANVVRLSPEYLTGKSLTAIAVAAHEVGHAIQFNRQEPVSRLRTKYLPTAVKMQKIGVVFLVGLPLISAILKVPQAGLLMLIFGVSSMLLSVLIRLAVLPEEWDASFNKALPILKQGGYVPDSYFPAIRQILKACAFTYIAAALADLLRLWRWMAILRFMR